MEYFLKFIMTWGDSVENDNMEMLLKNYLLKKIIPYKREHPVSLQTDIGIASNRIDFLISDAIVIELKAKRFISREDYYQMKRYLTALNLELGLLVNFQSFSIVTKRVLLRV